MMEQASETTVFAFSDTGEVIALKSWLQLILRAQSGVAALVLLLLRHQDCVVSHVVQQSLREYVTYSALNNSDAHFLESVDALSR